MEPVLVGAICIPSVLALVAIRVPIAVALISVSAAGIYSIIGLQPVLSLIAGVPYSTSASWTLSSVPMFLFMGYISYHTGLTRGLFKAARIWLGGLPGGLVIASLTGAGGFAAVTGSSIACAAAIGRIAVPEMVNHKYDVRLATGAVAAGGTLGALIPPSILLILFGIQAEVSIHALFLGGLILGLISLLFYVCVVFIIFAFAPDRLPRAESYPWSERFAALIEVWPVIVLMIIVFGGMSTGIFTATEAGAMGALCATLIGLARRQLNISNLMESAIDTLLASGSLFMIAIAANLFTRLLGLSGITGSVGDVLTNLGLGPVSLLIIITIIYLLLGMFLEPVGALLLTLPIFLPLIETTQIDLIWFGLLVAKLLEIGMITPPVGLNVFVIQSVAREYAKLEDVFAGVMPFVAADLVLITGMIAMRSFFA